MAKERLCLVPKSPTTTKTHPPSETRSWVMILSIVGWQRVQDIEIHCDEKLFPSHQNILSSKVYSLQGYDLRAEMKEKQTKKIVIKDVKPRTVAEMLNSCTLGISSRWEVEEMSGDLHRVADMSNLMTWRRCARRRNLSPFFSRNLWILVLETFYNAEIERRWPSTWLPRTWRRLWAPMFQRLPRTKTCPLRSPKLFSRKWIIHNNKNRIECLV